MYRASCVFIIVEVLEHHPKTAHSLPLLVFFVEPKEMVCVISLLSVCFSMIQYNKEKSSMKCPLNSAEDYNNK